MKSILFVDDDSKVLDGVRRMLHGDRDRWTLQFAVGGESALKACETNSFDVVVSDMLMPEMDGATLMGNIRDRFPHMARVILSGYSDAGLSARAASVAHRFLVKPCSADELRSTIERVCTLQELVCAPEIRRIVVSVGELPSLSTTLTDLRKAVNDPGASIGAVATIIEKDIAMAAKVLQLTNSAFFGLAQKVTNLTNAVSYLGMETIKNLALASEVFRIFRPDSRVPHSVCDSIQKHALGAAAIANVLPLEREERELAVVAALLHDIGKLFLASTMPVEFCASLALARAKGCKAFEAEEEILGTTHAEIGAYLLGLWGIPNLAVEAIAHHHHPTRISHSNFDCSVAVYLADLLAHELDAYPSGSMGVEVAEADRVNLEKQQLLSKLDTFRELALQSRSSGGNA
jgi:HD-like signal output (HDOD) protein/CheY-like chemotaxis protein